MGSQVIILGCGSSGGVPRIGGDWGVCDPAEPKNARTRSSILIQKWEGDGEPHRTACTNVLIDTSPDLRVQLLREDIRHLDAVFYTHDHADQSHGIDDLRAIAYRMRMQIPTFMDAYTKANFFTRFKYCFEMPEGRVHPPILALQELISDGSVTTVAGPGGTVSLETLEVSHGPTPSLGFLIDGKVAYSPDVWGTSDEVLLRLNGVNVWIVDSLRYSQHPTHAHTDKTLSWLAKAQVKSAVLTNLHIDMDYETLREQLPPIARPAYDGMRITA
jgi:phosphoribosyl 1,2-cyclic phosphate phosphodiesterase